MLKIVFFMKRHTLVWGIKKHPMRMPQNTVRIHLNAFERYWLQVSVRSPDWLLRDMAELQI